MVIRVKRTPTQFQTNSFYTPLDNPVRYYCLGIVPRAPGYPTVVGDKAPPAPRDSNEFARAYNQRCYHHTGIGGHSWCLSSGLSLSVGFPIQDDAMDVARSAPQGAHCHVDVIY